MGDGSRLLAPLLLVLYVGVTFVWRSYLVWRRTGVNPYVLSRGDDAEGIIARFFRLSMLLLVGVVCVYAVSGQAYNLVAPLRWLERPLGQSLGVVLLAASLVWTAVAQAQMGASWRIGIDAEKETELVERGLFARSRNPIFLGMRVGLLGFFFLLPNAVTLLTLVLGEVLIQLQVRLEEDFLTKTQGDAYRAYCRRVRRWL
jgi:protein-S-isoprenylcysteine O-methyltransferase Ste14